MPVLRNVPRPRTLREQLAGELAGLIDRFTLDAERALIFWASYRDKEPLLELVELTWPRLEASELLSLDLPTLHATTLACDEVGRFALWLRETEAAPATMERRLEAARTRLLPLAEAAIEALGGRPASSARPEWLETWRTLRR